jgi:hypothetical protein
MSLTEKKVRKEWVSLTGDTGIHIKFDDDIYYYFYGSKKTCLRLWNEHTAKGFDVRKQLDFGYSENLKTWYFSLKAGTVRNEDNNPWHDADLLFPEENVFVICRYDDYYFVGYMEDGKWYNHSAGDTILSTDEIKVEQWKRY